MVNRDTRKTVMEWWTEAEESAEKITTLSNSAVDEIRNRVIKWEDINEPT